MVEWLMVAAVSFASLTPLTQIIDFFPNFRINFGYFNFKLHACLKQLI